MFTEQVATIRQGLERIADPALRELLRPFMEGVVNAIGNCAQELKHRGDITYESDAQITFGGNTTAVFGDTEYTMEQINTVLSGGGGDGGGTWAHFTLASAKTRADNTASATRVRYSGEDPGAGFTVYDPSQNAPIWAGASGAYGKASKSTVDSRWYIDWLVCTPAGTGGGSFPYEVLVGQFAQGAY